MPDSISLEASKSETRVVDVDAHINDEECASVAVEELHIQFQGKA